MAYKQTSASIELLNLPVQLAKLELSELTRLVMLETSNLTPAQVTLITAAIAKANNSETQVPFDDPE